MTEEERKETESQSAAGAGAGESVRPSKRPEANSQEEDTSVQEIPIGLPINDEEFKRLKARAERASREEEQATADEDIGPQED